jgi:uncharacterized protein
MKVIIDTNILISAAISGNKPEEVINFIIASSDYQWVVSQSILDEYIEVLNRRKIKLNEEKRNRWLNLVNDSTVLIEVSETVNFPRDQKDAKFISCALASKANFLITGDRDFESVTEIGTTLIISVSLFHQIFIV